MKNFPVISLTLALACAAVLTCCNEKPASADTAQTPAPTLQDTVKRGEYLVGILGCNDCHSPKRMGPKGPEIIPELMLSGYPSDRPIGKPTPEALRDGWALFNADLTAGAGPWGISFAANLTPDDSGIGAWSFEQFKRALTEGKSKGLADGRMLLPPMPWTNYVHMKDGDLQAVFQYLKSIKPVRNVVPAPVPPAQN